MSGAEQPAVIVESHETFEIVTLNRPEQRNALDAATVDILHRYFDERETTPPEGLLIRGAGASFCSGFDLAGLDSATDGDLLHRFVRIELLLQRLFHAPFPVAAFAQGHAVGAGADLFCACALRWASADVRFRFPGWNFGLALGARRLAHVIGPEPARMTLLETRQLDADAASQLGLIQKRISPGEELDAMWRVMQSSAHLSRSARAGILELTRPDSGDLDLAALVRSAAHPGLRDRLTAYRQAMRGRSRTH